MEVYVCHVPGYRDWRYVAGPQGAAPLAFVTDNPRAGEGLERTDARQTDPCFSLGLWESESVWKLVG